jgi:hypothetical protein
MSKHIAVIGGGIFGSTIALRLHSDGHRIKLIESRNNILKGTSFNNTRRVHLGFHYPRDLYTAKQSFNGFANFYNKYRDCIKTNFLNYYLIAKQNSKTSLDEYFKFSSRLGAPFEKIIKNLPANTQNCDGGIKCSEHVYDCDHLRDLIYKEIKKSDISLELLTKVKSVTRNTDYQLSYDNSKTENFDAVINCSYYNINQFNKNLGIQSESTQYEYTINFIIDLPIQHIGITIMDGPFVTLLPFGKPGRFTLYHVKHSVLKTVINHRPPIEWENTKTAPSASVDIQQLFARTIEDSSFFIPILKKAKFVKLLESPRMVLANKDETDARPSILNVPIKNYLTVFSGKVDHCFTVSNKISNYFSN